MNARLRRAGEAAQRRIPPNGIDLPNSKRRDSLRYSRPTTARTHASIYPRPHSWRYVLLHRCHIGKKTSVADRTHRCFARSIRIRTGTTPFHNRRSGDPSRSFALHLDIAGRRRGFFGTLARHQIEIFPFLAKSGAAFNTPRCKRRTRDLAATLLGTRHTRRRRLHATHGLHPLQPRQTWPCATRLRLAIFDIPSSRSTRNVCAGLGRRRRRARDRSGVTMRRDALRSSRPTSCIGRVTTRRSAMPYWLRRAGAAALWRRIPPNRDIPAMGDSYGGIRCASPALQGCMII